MKHVRKNTEQKSTFKSALIAANVLVVLGLGGLSYYFWNETQQLQDVLGLSTEEKNVRLVEEVNQVYDLPEEAPIVAIVTNPDEFRAQYPAFDGAQADDYLLFFRKARLNVLYRQSEKKVVQTTDVIVPIAVEVVGDQDAVESTVTQLEEFGDQITIVRTQVSGITQSFVFDVDADQQTDAQSIAQQLDYDVGSTLPSAIVPGPQTEIVVAVSSDQSDQGTGQDSQAGEPDPGSGSALIESGLGSTADSADELQLP